MEFQPNTSSWLTENNTFKTPSDENPSIKRSKKKIKMAIVYCTKCKALIKEKHLYRIGEHFWHKSCVLCDNCTGQLIENGYLVDEKLLCNVCYFKSIHAPKCVGCNRLLLSNDYAMYSLNNPYHLTCFKCCICGNQINKGDHYVVSNGQLICKQDYEASRTACLNNRSQNIDPVKYNQSVMHNMPPMNAMINGNVQNGVRKKTKITPDQRIYLERYYQKNANPTIKQREIIAKELDLQPKVVQTWFCNYRTKLKLQKTNVIRNPRDRNYSDDQDSSSSNRMKNINNGHCMTPDQDYQPNPTCQLNQSLETNLNNMVSNNEISNTYNNQSNQYNCHSSLTSELINHHHSNNATTNSQQNSGNIVLQSSHLNTVNTNNNDLHSPISPSTHVHHQYAQHQYTNEHNQPFNDTSANNVTSSNNEITITDLSNSCAQSIEQSILAGFNAANTNNSSNNNTNNVAPIVD